MKEDIIDVYRHLIGGCKEDKGRLFSVVSSERTRGNRHEVKYRKLFKQKRKKEFTVILLIEHWNGWSRETVESSSLEILKTHSDRILSNLF